MDNRIMAVIDADFFIKTTEYDHGHNLFLQIMRDLNTYPVMHRFVADTELKDNPYLSSLISACEIKIMDYEDYLLTDTDRQEYDDFFRDAYEKLNRFSFPEKENVYEYRQPHENLGEIRSLYMAVKKGYHYFMSDDCGAKFLAKTYFSRKHAILVESLYEVLIRCRKKGTCLTWKDINPTVTNAMRSHQDRITALKELYRTPPETEA
ncbi:MAG: hypothetical protein NC541_03960 [bacterium]|nr:hypothetical protein [bacterium]